MKICIACEKDVEGMRAVRVKDDRVIRFFRSVKKTLGIARMNDLYVCEVDLPKHQERRKSFEKSMLFAVVLAGIVLVLVVIMLLLAGRFEVWALVSALIISGFILLLPFFRYAPAVEIPAAVRPPPPALLQAVAPVAPSPLAPVAKEKPKKRKR